MNKYDFKWAWEAGRAFVIAVIVFASAEITQIANGAEVEDWQAVAFSLGVGALSAGVAAALAAFTRNKAPAPPSV